MAQLSVRNSDKSGNPKMTKEWKHSYCSYKTLILIYTVHEDKQVHCAI